MENNEISKEVSEQDASLEDELYGSDNTNPNALAQPSIGVQASIIARLLLEEGND